MNAPSANPPLIAAADKGDMAAIERLLAEGAKVDARDETGRTALMAATQRNNLPLARRLMKQAALTTALPVKARAFALRLYRAAVYADAV